MSTYRQLTASFIKNFPFIWRPCLLMVEEGIKSVADHADYVAPLALFHH